MQVAPGLASEGQAGNFAVPLNPGGDASALGAALDLARERFGDRLEGLAQPVPDEALDGLKFSDLLPEDLAARTLAVRLQDPSGVAAVLSRGITVRTTIS